MKKFTRKSRFGFLVVNGLLLIILFYPYVLYIKRYIQPDSRFFTMFSLVILIVLVVEAIGIYKLSNLLEIVSEREKKSKKDELTSHLFALQSQMNLHFWHNILGMISLDAQLRNDKKTTSLCRRLSKMLYFSASTGDGFCTLGDELNYVDQYLSLMKERYEDSLEYTIEVPDSMKSIRIPKFIIQPICENAFIHAFKDKPPVWVINIMGYVQDNHWFIHVGDNGYGFTEDLISNFNTMKTNIKIDNTIEEMRKLSIGGLSLPNVYLRLLLCYKEKIIFQLNNTDKGAVVILGGQIQ